MWSLLKTKYMAEDASSKMFLVSNFNNFKIDDNCPIIEHFYEIQRMYDNLKRHDMNRCKEHPQAQKEEIDLTQLAIHLLIKVTIRDQEKGKDPSSISTINMVGENSNKYKFVTNKKMGSSSFKGKFSNFSKKPTFGGCWFCRKLIHHKKYCFLFKKKNANKGEALIAKTP